MAKTQRISPAAVHRIWQAHQLQRDRVTTFKLSRDPEFVRKLRDVVGLYLNPPAKALVLSVDEKSQIQVLDRTQPLLPLRPGLPTRQTHDYTRHGTTTLFAALNVLEGQVIGACHPHFTRTSSSSPSLRFHFHFTPTGASWLNLVERWFAEITRKRIRRGAFRSVPALVTAIRAYVREHNKDPRPFI